MNRKRLPDERRSRTHKFVIYSDEIGPTKFWVTVGLYEDGTPGELFVRMNKEGSTIRALLDQWATAISIGLQSGVPLETFTDKFSYCQFEPMGQTSNPEIPQTQSPVDYIAQWLSSRFGKDEK